MRGQCGEAEAAAHAGGFVDGGVVEFGSGGEETV